jgi:hypothetical protein
MAVKKIIKYFEIWKSAYGLQCEQKSAIADQAPQPTKLNARIIKLEFEVDDSMFDINPITVNIDMKESTKQISEINNNIVIPVRHSIVDDSIMEKK